jgi:hypothetical protein
MFTPMVAEVCSLRGPLKKADPERQKPSPLNPWRSARRALVGRSERPQAKGLTLPALIDLWRTTASDIFRKLSAASALPAFSAKLSRSWTSQRAVLKTVRAFWSDIAPLRTSFAMAVVSASATRATIFVDFIYHWHSQESSNGGNRTLDATAIHRRAKVAKISLINHSLIVKVSLLRLSAKRIFTLYAKWRLP